MKTIKTTTLLIAAIIFLSACSKERMMSDRAPSGARDAEVLLHLKTPGDFSAPISRGLSYEDENRISTIHLLVFNSANMLVTIKEGQNVTSLEGYTSFSVMLTPSATTLDTYNLVVLANAQSILASTIGLNDYTSGFIGNSYENVIAAINAQISDKMYTSGGVIPMWGESGDMVIKLGNNNKSMKLTRAVARIDVGVGKPARNELNNIWSWDGKDANENPIPFELANVYVIRPNDHYAVVPDAAKPVGEPTIPAEAVSFTIEQSKGTFKYSATPSATGGYTSRDIYIPEADIVMSATGKPADSNHHNRMAIVVGGYYDGSATETFYRLDFAMSGKLVNALRNHLYQFNISGVLGAGYRDVETAYNAMAMNMTVEVFDWDENNMGDIYFDDAYYFSIAKREVIFTPLDNQTEVITIKTNVHDFAMWDMTGGSDINRLQANGTLTWTNISNGYIYTLVRGGSDIYTLTIHCSSHNISKNPSSRKDEWKFVAKRMNIPFSVEQQWANIFLSIEPDQTTRLYPEGTAGAMLPIDIISLTPVTISGIPEWVEIADGNPADALTQREGLYSARLLLTVPAFDVSELGAANRTANIKITPDGEPPIEYNIIQEAPFVFFNRTNIFVTRPASPQAVIDAIDVMTNIPAADLGIEHIEGSELIKYNDSKGLYLLGAALRPRYLRFDIVTDLTGNTPDPFSAKFEATPDAKYGIEPVTINVNVPDAITVFDSWWYRAGFGVTAPVQWWEPTRGTVKNNNFTFPWNTLNVWFDIESNKGALFYAPESTTNGGTLTKEDETDNIYEFSFVINNTNYSATDSYQLTFQNDPAIDPTMFDFRSVAFERGAQQWSRTAVSNNTVEVGYPGIADGSPQTITTVTNNVEWKYWFAGWAPASPADWAKVRAGADALATPTAALPTKRNDRIFAPVTDAADLNKTAQVQISAAAVPGPIRNAQATDVAATRTVTLNFANDSYDVTRGGPNLTNQTITVKQYAPRAFLVSGLPATIPYWGNTNSLTISTNLASTWGVKVYEGTSNAGTHIALNTGTAPAGADRLVGSNVAVSFTVPKNSGIAGRTLSFWVYASTSGLTGKTNEVKIAEVVQAEYIGGYADRIAVSGTGDNAKLVITTVTTNPGVYFKFGSVVSIPYTGNVEINSAFVFNPLITPSSITGYGDNINVLPAVPSFTSTHWDNGIRNVSLDNYHNLANVKAGRGDPCRLIGMTAGEIRGFTTDAQLYAREAALKAEGTGGWRLPTYSENQFFVDRLSVENTNAHWWTAATSPFGGVAGGEFPNRGHANGGISRFLPAAGYRSYTGYINQQGLGGYYWSSEPGSNIESGYIRFGDTDVTPRHWGSYAIGMSVRCVRQ